MAETYKPTTLNEVKALEVTETQPDLVQTVTLAQMESRKRNLQAEIVSYQAKIDEANVRIAQLDKWITEIGKE